MITKHIDYNSICHDSLVAMNCDFKAMDEHARLENVDDMIQWCKETQRMLAEGLLT